MSFQSAFIPTVDIIEIVIISILSYVSWQFPTNKKKYTEEEWWRIVALLAFGFVLSLSNYFIANAFGILTWIISICYMTRTLCK